MKKLFGTDGVRGVAGEFLTSEFSYKLGKYIADYFIGGEGKKVFIASDTRESKDMIKLSLAAAITSMGLDIYDLNVTSTPEASYIISKNDSLFGIVVSASHNPYEYNGIKVFNKDGYKLADEVEEAIETNMLNDKELKKPERFGNYITDEIDKTEYISYLRSLMMDYSGLKIVCDMSNGANYVTAKEVLNESGAEMIYIHDEPNGRNINKNCGSTHLESLVETVKNNKADIGIAFDGDADRLLVVDNEGKIMDGDHILAALATYLKKHDKLKKNKLVATIMSNIGLKKYLDTIGVELDVTSVGDRYVLAELIKDDLSLGGEQSGHIILKDYQNTGDGILSAIFLINAMTELKKTAAELNGLMKTYPQVLLNAKVTNEIKNKVLDIKSVKNAIDDLTKNNPDMRVVIRPSGTEPLLRVMLEGEDEDELKRLAKDLVDLIERETK